MTYDKVKFRLSCLDRASNDSMIDDYAQHLDSAVCKPVNSRISVVGYIPSRHAGAKPNIKATIKEDSATFEGSPLKWYLGAEGAIGAGLQDFKDAVQALADAIGESVEVLERAKLQGVELCRDIELTTCKASEAIERIRGIAGYEKEREYNGSKYFTRIGAKDKRSRVVRTYNKKQELSDKQGITTDRELLRIELALKGLAKSLFKVKRLGDLLTAGAWQRAEDIISDIVQSIMIEQLEGLSPEQVANAIGTKQESNIALYATMIAIGGVDQYLQALKANGMPPDTYKKRRKKAREVWKHYESTREKDRLEQELKA